MEEHSQQRSAKRWGLSGKKQRWKLLTDTDGVGLCPNMSSWTRDESKSKWNNNSDNQVHIMPVSQKNFGGANASCITITTISDNYNITGYRAIAWCLQTLKLHTQLTKLHISWDDTTQRDCIRLIDDLNFVCTRYFVRDIISKRS